MTALLREVIGDVLRHARNEQGRTLREVSDDARVSLGYLSEVERGQKEPSSELLAAICSALDVQMSDLFREVTDTFLREERRADRAGFVVAPKAGAAGLSGPAAPTNSLTARGGPSARSTAVVAA